MTSRRVLLGLCLLAAPAAAERLAVELVAPHPAATLPAGGAVEFAWEFVGAPPAGATEWEVFLSLDGGRSYPARLTPHLDLGRRRVTVRLPDTPTNDARFLLRVGDEREEVGVELPGVFTLAAGPVSAPAPLALPALARGESARPGQLGVRRWVEGGRDGSGWREVATRSEPEIRATLVPGALDLGGSLPPRRPDPEHQEAALAGLTTGRPAAPRLVPPAPPALGRPLLLLLRRRNC